MFSREKGNSRKHVHHETQNEEISDGDWWTWVGRVNIRTNCFSLRGSGNNCASICCCITSFNVSTGILVSVIQRHPYRVKKKKKNGPQYLARTGTRPYSYRFSGLPPIAEEAKSYCRWIFSIFYSNPAALNAFQFMTGNLPELFLIIHSS